MTKSLLIEHYNCSSNAKLVESSSVRPGTLGRFKVICCDYLNETANGRLYSKGLWEKAKAKRMNDRIAKKLAFGELDHPADRLEPLGKYAAVNLVEFIDCPEEGKYYGVFDILDTEDGKKIKTYLDYGSQIGVSSRGAGDIVRLEGRQCIDEDSYDWEAFDVVLDPAVSCSKAFYVESVNRDDFTDKFKKDISESVTREELNTLESLLNYTELSNKESLIEMINTKRDSIKSEEESFLSGLLGDLERSTNKIKDLEESNANLLKEKSASSTRVVELGATNRKLVNANKSLNKLVEKLENTNNHLNTRIKSLYSDNKAYKDSINNLESKYESLKVSASNMRAKIVESRNNSAELSKEMTHIKEEYNTKVSTKLESVMNTNKLLKEENDKYKNLEKVLRENNNKLMRRYIKSEAISKGISESELNSRLSSLDLTIENIDMVVNELCESKEALRALPFRVTDGELVESTQPSVDPAFERAIRMHKAVSGNKNG